LAEKSIIIVGAGIAGLSTGCYAQMNGYRSRIFEMQDKPGGVCTSWNRKGYIFDYCIHNLVGTGKESGVRKVWAELGALQGTEIIDHDTFGRIEGPNGEVLNLYTDLNKLERHLKEIAPEDSKIINEYIKAARSFLSAGMFSMGLGGLRRKLKMIAHIRGVMKWSKITLDDFSERFSNPFLKEAFSHIQYDATKVRMPLLINLMFMSGLHSGDLGWPHGGSLEFSRRIEKRYLDLGGQISYKSSVAKIIVKDDRAIGVRLVDGTEHFADIIVSAADGHSTIFEMLDGKYTNELIQRYYESVPKSQPFGLEVFVGVNRDLSSEPHAITLLFNKALTIEGMERNSLYLELFTEKTGLAPRGKSIIKTVMVGSYEYWKSRRSDLERYNDEKKKVYEVVADRIETRFPGIKKQVEVWDVITPVTVERYTNNFHGYEPWIPKEAASKIMRKGLSATLPGLRDFHMVGHWSAATIGIPTVAVMGRNLVKKICKEDGKRFVTSVT
jgi:phytoene dehydrogenase-like protein